MRKLKDFPAGGELKDQLCRISGIRRMGDRFIFNLKDSESTLEASVAEALYGEDDLRKLAIDPVYVTGAVLPKKNLDGKYVKVKKIVAAESNKENEKELLSCIPDEKLEEYINTIRKYAASVKNPNYRELLNLFFSEENLVKMRTMPATHTRQGALGGGMLQATATVTTFCVSLANHYTKLGNGVYNFPIDWDLLLTGALMHLAGNLVYFDPEPPHLKSSNGVNQGYASCEQSAILYHVYGHGVALTGEELSMLLGVVAQCNEYRAGVKACCQEAIILRGAYALFTHLDCFDHEVTDCLKESGADDDGIQSYLFSSGLNMYASAPTLAKAQESTIKEGA